MGDSASDRFSALFGARRGDRDEELRINRRLAADRRAALRGREDLLQKAVAAALALDGEEDRRAAIKRAVHRFLLGRGFEPWGSGGYIHEEYGLGDCYDQLWALETEGVRLPEAALALLER